MLTEQPIPSDAAEGRLEAAARRWTLADGRVDLLSLDRPALDYAIDGDTTLRRLETELEAAEATAAKA